MLKYLIVQLDDTSTSFCHYENNRKERNLISLEILKKAVLWSMKENLMVQFLYPDYELPEEYKKAIDEIDHVDIVSSECKDRMLRENAEVVVFNSTAVLNGYDLTDCQAYVLRTTVDALCKNVDMISDILSKVARLSIVLTDVERFDKENQLYYKEILERLTPAVEKNYIEGNIVQLNVLTDRIMLEKMNNCNAGDEWIAVCPDGKFYICPAFYLNDQKDEGNLSEGLNIRNPQLYKLSNAPICRQCDAFQCKRCVWLNRRLTLEVNTPSHEQCVMSHLERNATRDLQLELKKQGIMVSQHEIPKIDYLDPFDKILEK